MTRFWGDNEEARTSAKRTIETHLQTITEKQDHINIQDLFKLLWNDYHLFEHYLRLVLRLEELESEAKITIDSMKNLKPVKMTVLESNGLKEIKVWDFYNKKEKVDINKRIIERYKKINYLT
ncbi:MAG: hypothetical protein GOP50_11145 [Candidatus Heimdallarchaeota archaeon]|nr:hypothetical protein [Candidatus Heimdallarchaeota archaeon]